MKGVTFLVFKRPQMCLNLGSRFDGLIEQESAFTRMCKRQRNHQLPCLWPFGLSELSNETAHTQKANCLLPRLRTSQAAGQPRHFPGLWL